MGRTTYAMTMLILNGTIIKGSGAASGNLKTQLRRIAEEFPEVNNCFHGTLNIELDRALLVVSPDHRTKPIDWHLGHSPGEVFDFLRIRFEVAERRVATDAWI